MTEQALKFQAAGAHYPAAVQTRLFERAPGHTEQKRLCMKRLRAERNGTSTAQYPNRVRRKPKSTWTIRRRYAALAAKYLYLCNRYRKALGLKRIIP